MVHHNDPKKRTYERSGTARVPDPVPDNVPQHHVNDEDDQGGKRSKGRQDGHHDGGKARGADNGEKAHDESEEGDAARDGVDNEGLAQALKGGFTGQVDAVALVTRQNSFQDSGALDFCPPRCPLRPILLILDNL